MWTLGTPAIEIVIRSAIIYAVFFGALRVFGKREIGQFTLFDLALVLLAANALQPAMTGPDQSITGGLIIVATLFILNRGVAALRVRSPLVRRTARAQSARPPAPRIRPDGRRPRRSVASAGARPAGPGPHRRRGRPSRAWTRRRQTDEAGDPGSRWSDQHRRYGSRGEIRDRAPTASLSPAALTRSLAQRRRRRAGPRVSQSTITPTTQAINRRIQ